VEKIVFEKDISGNKINSYRTEQTSNKNFLKRVNECVQIIYGVYRERCRMKKSSIPVFLMPRWVGLPQSRYSIKDRK
jgi:hypothetical protein